MMHPISVAIVTRDNLEAGIERWRTEKSTWPSDFHNQFYLELQVLRCNGLDLKWWRSTVDHLAAWRAIRPLSKQEIYERGLTQLAKLHKEYDRLCRVISNSKSAGLHNIFWHEVSRLYQIAFAVKGVNSPVFGSKLCHFILPQLFPVVDQEVVGVNTTSYEEYWRFCKREWERCQAKESLIERLSTAIGGTPMSSYPFSTKIVELCIIGHRRRN